MKDVHKELEQGRRLGGVSSDLEYYVLASVLVSILQGKNQWSLTNQPNRRVKIPQRAPTSDGHQERSGKSCTSG